MEYRVKATGSDYSFHAEIGVWDETAFDGQGGFAFGDSAEIFGEMKFGSDVRTYEVSFAAIGSHDTARARRRLASYQKAIEIAESANATQMAFDAAAAMLNGSVV